MVSVLRFQGYSVEYEEVAAACRLDPAGAVQELALQGLREEGWDVELLPDLDMEAIREAIDEERPPIICLRTGFGEENGGAHAVVVCEATDQYLTVMDPLAGDYLKIPLREVEASMTDGLTRGFLVSGPGAAA